MSMTANMPVAEPDPAALYEKLLSLTTHTLTREIAELLRDNGWRPTVNPYSVIFTHPNSDIELPTPEHFVKDWHYGKTYTQLRQLTASFSNCRFTKVWRRTSAGPWVAISESPISFKAAKAYVAEDWSPAARAEREASA